MTETKDLRIAERERILAATSACIAEHGPCGFASIWPAVKREERGATPKDVHGSLQLLVDIGAISIVMANPNGEPRYDTITKAMQP